jgi:hypothetical protein
MKRAALIGLTALGAAVMLGPGSAGAGGGQTVVTTTGSPGTGLQISVTAAPGEQNDIRGIWRNLGGVWNFRDTKAGISEDSPHCRQVNPTTVRCDGTGVERVSLSSGDRSDVLRMDSSSPPVQADLLGLTVDGGAGNDRLGFFGTVGNLPSGASFTILGQGGGDRIELVGQATARGQGGNDTLIGREGDQRLFGGRAMDRITADGGDEDYCNGGGGDDRGGAGCETKISL